MLRSYSQQYDTAGCNSMNEFFAILDGRIPENVFFRRGRIYLQPAVSVFGRPPEAGVNVGVRVGLGPPEGRVLAVGLE